MSRSRLLIAGIGNLFLGDDAFGVEVARRLARRPLPEGDGVVDFGTRGLDLAYALMDGFEAVILVDAVPRGGQPGSVYVLEPEGAAPAGPTGADLLVDAHSLDPAKVLRLVASPGGQVRRLLLVGCEPGTADPKAMSMGLSAPVAAAVDEAVTVIESLTGRLLAGEGLPPVVETERR
jgi:hydrogenase maturation protease